MKFKTRRLTEKAWKSLIKTAEKHVDSITHDGGIFQRLSFEDNQLVCRGVYRGGLYLYDPEQDKIIVPRRLWENTLSSFGFKF